ncbi:glycosyltransferase [Bacteroidia bacterium]|nr:glycosyltransferase [Bacteroidia bacterium]
MPFRNEEANLPALLDSLNALNMHDHSVEVVFIDDKSMDRGVDIIENTIIELSQSIISNKEKSGKKAAMQLGWEVARGDIILQTDADCVFESEWLAKMVEPFQDERINLVSGPVSYGESKGFWRNLLALDFVALIAIGAAHIEWKLPMICNGANMAYRKSITSRAELNTSKASGDDVFLLQSAQQLDSDGIIFSKSSEAIVSTNGPDSFMEFWNQRLRWASKNGDYDIKKNTYILKALWVYNITILISLFTFSALGFTAALYLVLLKVLAEDKLYSSFSSFFGIETWFKTLLLGQPFHIIYMAIVPPLSQFLKYQWKERKLS